MNTLNALNRATALAIAFSVGLVTLCLLSGDRTAEAQKGGKAPPGKVVVHDRDKVFRFSQPVTVAPRTVPPIVREGHSWRWHPRIGWTLLPVGVAGTAVVLPETFVLPAQVQIYQPAVTVVEGQFIEAVCPNCGRPLRLHIK